MSAATEEASERWQRPAVRVPGAHHTMLGTQVAEQTIIAQADAGMSPDRIEAVQEEIAARNLNEATTPAGRAFARAYDDTARTLVRDLRDLEGGE
jgi:hypothetical protein